MNKYSHYLVCYISYYVIISNVNTKSIHYLPDWIWDCIILPCIIWTWGKIRTTLKVGNALDLINFSKVYIKLINRVQYGSTLKNRYKMVFDCFERKYQRTKKFGLWIVMSPLHVYYAVPVFKRLNAIIIHSPTNVLVI